jgi:phage recombination protein Bet
MNSVIAWENIEKVRQLFAPTLTTDEMAFFVSLGKNLGANPFTREIWAVKYDRNQPAAIFCGRDFYRRIAQEQPDYEGHNAQALYSNDIVEIENGEVKKHVPSLRDPGEIIGAYCILWRTGKRPFFHLVRFREYFKGFSNWKTMPETMIKKVAEAQTLRMAYQGIFRGTYDESEDWTGAGAQTSEARSVVAIAATDTVKSNDKTSSSTSTADKPPSESGSIPLTISQISKVLDPRLRGIFNRMQFTTGKIMNLFQKYGLDGQDKIIEELSIPERKAA